MINSSLQLAELKILYEIASLIVGGSSLQQKCTDALKTLKMELNLQKCAIYLLEDDVLSIFSSIDLNFQQEKLSKYKLGEGATGLSAKSKEPVIVENVYNSVLFLNRAGSRDSKTISYIAVPMIIDDSVVGVLGAHLKPNSQISFDETIKVLTVVSSLIAQAITISKKNEIEKIVLKEQNEYYKSEIIPNFGEIIGNSPKIKAVFDVIKKVAKSKATVLIRGETGTGKELIASAIHNQSQRSDGPFIKLNCAAITETLLESELFGHEKGAFTDAKATKKGRFELADGGTLFLDEIGDISMNLQVKLLRVLQEQEFERVGGTKSIKVDVRVITATNRDLETMIKEGKFREDLFYRLNVIPIYLPALRERDGDIELLLNHFLDRFSSIHKKNLKFKPKAIDLLKSYPWYGNIRELQNSVERIVLMSEDEEIDSDLVEILLPNFTKIEKEQPNILTHQDLEDIEKKSIKKALDECGGIQAKAAKKLGLTQRQLGYKIKKYEL